MVKIGLLILFYFTFPLLIIFLCKKWTVLQKLGTIVLAYLFGLMLGTSGIFPDGSQQYIISLQGRPSIPPAEMVQLVKEGTLSSGDVWANQIADVQNTTQAVILLAFPLLLFSIDIRKWLKYAKKGFISVVLALVAGIVMVTAGFFIWKDSIPESWKLAGMFEGIYTGGTPNFVALKMALNVDPALFVVVNTYDMIVGAFLVLFFITIGPKIFRYILPKFTEEKGIEIEESEIVKETENLEDFSGMLSKRTLLPLLKALGFSIVIFGISFGLSLVLPKLPQMVVIVLSITTLSIAASMFKQINRIEKTFQLGMYLIIVFSLVIASMADLRTMFNIGMVNLILFITWCYFGSLILHLILAKIFRVDADNFLITATAFIFSPPFVPMVANALKNKNVIVTGIAGGIIGYVLGNYFGIALAYFLKGF
jgi:uncharacterized membrane protein